MIIEKSEYGDFYERYVKLSNGVPIVDLFQSNLREVLDLFAGLNEEDSLYRYKENKWTLKEVLGHMTDTERIFNYRALSIARRDPEPLPGFDQELYVKSARFNEIPLDQLKDQYQKTRESTIALYAGFNNEELLRRGKVSGYSFTVRATGYVIAGHEIHHLNIIDEKYLPGLTE